MTEIRLALPVRPIDPNKFPYLSLKIDELDCLLQVGQKIQIRKGQLASSIGMFLVMVISSYQGYVLVRAESSSVLKEVVEIYKSLYPGEYILLNLEEYDSMYPLPECF